MYECYRYSFDIDMIITESTADHDKEERRSPLTTPGDIEIHSLDDLVARLRSNLVVLDI